MRALTDHYVCNVSSAWGLPHSEAIVAITYQLGQERRRAQKGRIRQGQQLFSKSTMAKQLVTATPLKNVLKEALLGHWPTRQEIFREWFPHPKVEALAMAACHITHAGRTGIKRCCIRGAWSGPKKLLEAKLSIWNDIKNILGVYETGDGYFVDLRRVVELDYEAKGSTTLRNGDPATNLFDWNLVHVGLGWDGRTTSKYGGQTEVVAAVLTPDNPDMVNSA
eukprot:3937731-Rhodomonas_salina.1